MSLEFFEHFLRTEISRHPSLGAALQLKSNLRRCSQQFERAVADLHYRLIKTAVQLLFSRVSSARLQELSSACSSSCETKYIITDSSHKGSPNSRSTQVTENEQCSSRWDAQSNNSQTLRQTPRSPRRRGVSSGVGGGQHKGQTSGSRWLSRAKDTKQQQQLQHQQHSQQQHQKHSQQQLQQQHQHSQQQQQHTQCNSQQPHTQCSSQQQHTQCNSHQQPQQQQQQPQQKATCAPPRSPPTRPPPPPSPPSPARPQLTTREGPTYSYPGAGHHNRRAMSGWYVANMDALLSNLMRLFELIYRDTLRMCGVGDCDLRQLRNALPDPTLLSMQQRSGGAWRPNYMNCKIDFLLHLAAMVYRNTQDLRCGCECSMPADPCWPFGDKRDNPLMSAPDPAPVPASVVPGWVPRRDDEHLGHNLTCNRNNAAATVAAIPGDCGCDCNCRTPEDLSPKPLAVPIASHRRSRCHRRRRRRRSQSSSTELETTSASLRPDNNSNNANTGGSSIGGGDGGGSRSRRRQRRRQFTKSVVRSRAMVLSSDASTTTTTATVDTARTCLSVNINMPL